MNKRQLLIVWLLYSKMKIAKMRFINTWCIEYFHLEIWNQHKPQNSQYYSHLNENWSASLYTIQVGPILAIINLHIHKQTNLCIHNSFTIKNTHTHPHTHIHAHIYAYKISMAHLIGCALIFRLHENCLWFWLFMRKFIFQFKQLAGGEHNNPKTVNSTNYSKCIDEQLTAIRWRFHSDSLSLTPHIEDLLAVKIQTITSHT